MDKRKDPRMCEWKDDWIMVGSGFLLFIVQANLFGDCLVEGGDKG